MQAEQPESMSFKKNEDIRPKSEGFFPAIRRHLTSSCDHLDDEASSQQQSSSKANEKPPASSNLTKNDNNPDDAGTMPKPDLPEQKTLSRKKKQRKMKQLEERLHKEQKKISSMVTPTGQRVFELPNRVKPVSLFIRIGSLTSDQDPVPLEYYGSLTDSEEEQRTPSTAHPAAQQTMALFHLGNGSVPRISPLPFDQQSDINVNNNRKFEETKERELSPLHIATNNVPDTHSRGSKTKRPYSVQFPLPSAMKKSDADATKRPRSLRFLDPKNQKLYGAVSHREFLSRLGSGPYYGEDDEDETELRRSLEGLDIRGQGSLSSAVESTSPVSDPVPISARRSRRSRGSSPPLPLSEVGYLADTERSSISDWNLAETIESTDLNTIPELRYSSSKSMPILTSRADFTSGESSDVSGYEADFEEKLTTRRGSATTK